MIDKWITDAAVAKSVLISFYCCKMVNKIMKTLLASTDVIKLSNKFHTANIDGVIVYFDHIQIIPTTRSFKSKYDAFAG